MKGIRRMIGAIGRPAGHSDPLASGAQIRMERSETRKSWRRRRFLRWIWAAALGWTACAPAPAPVGSDQAAATTAPAPGRLAGRITLITGDRVTLDATSGAASIHVEPGQGRGQVGFVTVRHADDVLVIPHDVAPLIASGRVDRALFDVTRLIADGYGDGDRDDLPLIVTGAPAGLVRAARSAGDVTVDRVIPALGVTALRQRKSSPGAALAMVQPPAGAFAATAGPARLWLDRRRTLVLDHSVPQIGGPAAWARGLTGEGIVVAVLDSGIDASHPDLAGKVVAAEAFVDDGLGTSDIAGHATHVASILAGSGAASDGQYRGVAPDARLLSGRVCSIDAGISFCPDSAILAGMAWAVVEQRAPIVNLSLGGTDEPGEDPLEAAVNQLSAQYGTLFVVAAGNEGRFGERTIESPGSAEAALTVGAVDRDDQLAAFSSRGPGLDGHAIKPDVTAPGAGIVAAMATTLPPIGEPVGTAYQRLSGTSMATPHVAGAAAILLQQHPGWTGAEIKAALIGTARPSPGTTVFAQGAGRIDVDRATGQAVIAAPGSLSLGIARWPHTDDPVLTRRVTYRNAGAAPVSLVLTARLATGGGAAPAGMIRIEPAVLEVPAGGSADATVTVDTNGDAPDEDYSGGVTAVAGDLQIVTPVAVAREIESYDLTLRARDRAGDPAAAFVLAAARRRDAQVLFLDVDGETTQRLPRDEYAVYAFPEPNVSMTAPRVVLDRELTLELDARLARPVEVELRGVALDMWSFSVETWDPANGMSVLNAVSNVFSRILGDGVQRQLFTGQVGADAPAEFRSWALVSAVPPGSPDGTIFDRPAIADPYAFAHLERGQMITGWRETLDPAQLTTVAASHVAASHSRLRRHLWLVLDESPELGGLVESDFFDYPAIGHRTEHLFGPGFRWGTQMSQDELFPDVPPEFGRFNLGEWMAVPRYRAGHHYVEGWHHAPFGPSLGQAFRGPPAARTGDRLTISPSMFSDRNLPARSNWAASTSRRVTLSRDGAVIVQSDDSTSPFWFPSVAVPPDPATYRFEQDETRGPWVGATMFELSTHVTAAWTFWSQHVVGEAPAILALPTVRFVPELDDDDRAPGRVMLLPVVIERPPGAATPRIARITVEISFDDGATWSRVPGVAAGDRWLGLVVHPAGAPFASLRGRAEDVEGRSNEVTIVRAYRVTAP